MPETLGASRERTRELADEDLHLLNARTGADPEVIRGAMARLDGRLRSLRTTGRSLSGLYDAAKREFAIPLESAQEKEDILGALSELSIRPWEENGMLIIDHPSDLETLKIAGYIQDVLPPASADETANTKAHARDSWFAYPYPPSAIAQERATLEQSRARREFEKEIASEKYGEIIPMDEEIERIVNDFDAGKLDDEGAQALRARFDELPTLTVFPQKYVWLKGEAYNRRSGEKIPKEQLESLYTEAKEDPKKLEEVVRLHVGLVMHILARVLERWRGAALDADDLFQMGVIGLYRAAMTYDQSKGKFSSHAGRHIEGQMRHFAAEYQKPVRLPTHTSSIRSRYHKKSGPMEVVGPLDKSELARLVTGWSSEFALDRFERTYFIHTRFDPLDETFGESPANTVDMNAQPLSVHDAHREYSEVERMRVVQETVRNLPGRDAMVLCMRFGIIPSKPLDISSVIDGSYEFGYGNDRPQGRTVEQLISAARAITEQRARDAYVYGRPLKFLETLEAAAGDAAITDRQLESMAPQHRFLLACLGKLKWDQIQKFNVDRDFTFEEVAEFYGVTRERIRQIEAHAIRALKHPARSKKLSMVLDRYTESNS